MQGQIIRLISNQYLVLLDDQRIVDCIARGKVRLQMAPVVGDRVEVEHLEDKFGIEKIYPRLNYLKRPPMANIDQAIIVMSAVEPDFSALLVDQLIFLISCERILPILLVTKMDLVKPDDQIYQHIADYRNSGYQVILTGKEYDNFDVLSALLAHKVTVLTGQSGVGKSSFLNRLDPTFELITQEISVALGRGKHTTRHVELHAIGEGWIADTPGFSKLDFSLLTKEQLAASILDFQPYQGKCRFRDCLHDKEPGCCIKEAVANGTVSSIRYQHYLECLGYIEEGRKASYD
ncbi:MAG: ribosome small subunit-dependent GTPase A [Erysipelotrichaceae bacterium]|nr:ribosome small subunit-dependent GTPase A [Erysipelotrichaceae bacterium]